MPRYDYRCPRGHVTESIHPMSQVPPVIECATCLASAERMFSPPAAIHFKGSGFYATDVKSTTRRRRRANAGDDLYKPFDHGAAKIADAI